MKRLVFVFFLFLCSVWMFPNLLGQTSPRVKFRNVGSKWKNAKSEVEERIVKRLLGEPNQLIDEIVVDFCGKKGSQSADNKGLPLVKIAVNRNDGSSSVIYVEIRNGNTISESEYPRLLRRRRRQDLE